MSIWYQYKATNSFRASWVSDCEKGYVSTAEFYWDDSENPERPHLLQAYRVQEIVVNVSWRERQVLVNASFLMNSNSETCLWIPALMLELDCFRCWLTFSLWRCQSRRCWPSGAPFLSPSLSWYFPAAQSLHLYILHLFWGLSLLYWKLTRLHLIFQEYSSPHTLNSPHFLFCLQGYEHPCVFTYQTVLVSVIANTT